MSSPVPPSPSMKSRAARRKQHVEESQLKASAMRVMRTEGEACGEFDQNLGHKR